MQKHGWIDKITAVANIWIFWISVYVLCDLFNYHSNFYFIQSENYLIVRVPEIARFTVLWYEYVRNLFKILNVILCLKISIKLTVTYKLNKWIIILANYLYNWVESAWYS